MLKIEYTTQFKRDLKLSKRRNKDLNVLKKIMKKIENKEKLESKLKDHALSGNWQGHRELHIEPDWLLIYKIFSEERLLIFVRLGSHADLFK